MYWRVMSAIGMSGILTFCRRIMYRNGSAVRRPRGISSACGECRVARHFGDRLALDDNGISLVGGGAFPVPRRPVPAGRCSRSWSGQPHRAAHSGHRRRRGNARLVATVQCVLQHGIIRSNYGPHPKPSTCATMASVSGFCSRGSHPGAAATGLHPPCVAASETARSQTDISPARPGRCGTRAGSVCIVQFLRDAGRSSRMPIILP